MRIPLNNGWGFTESFTDELHRPDCALPLKEVRFPHTVKETPFHYFDEQSYQMVSGYRKEFIAPEEWEGKRILLTFEGVAHSALVYLNGTLAGEHHCGYTAFTVELTDFLQIGKKNVLVVQVDSRESQNIPPFGFVIDYMTYGGIYREAYLEVKQQTYLKDIYARALVPDDLVLPGQEGERDDRNSRLRDYHFQGTLIPQIQINGEQTGLSIRCSLRDLARDDTVSLGCFSLDQAISIPVTNAKLWDVISPNLYALTVELLKDEQVLDTKQIRIGFRRSEFRKDGYYLNGRKLKLRGLNRHQSYPYVGYAMPASIQKMDADVLKTELGLNAVRTSHYPQSQHFLDRCDEIGLLVFTEIPGWQHIGDDSWKNQAVRNVEEMVTQNRNHPSVILWGVRINESQDDDALYLRTNEKAHSLDPDRPTSGVRFIKKSSLLEDVYAYNDFSHSGQNDGCIQKDAATSDPEKPYFISEYNGHMFPTKAYDDEPHRQEHALRHANVLNAVAAHPDIAGSFGWCMSDYNTHKDFGSGDRICYHGVLDMFRNPKMAAMVYASQQERTPVLAISSSMDIGEHPASSRGNVWMFTNAESVRMYKNGKFIKEYHAKESPYQNLRHGPIVLDSWVEEEIAEKEGFTPRQAELVKAILNYCARFGMDHLSAPFKAKAAELMLRYHMSFEDAYQLYQKYIGDWGGESTVFRFEAIRDGKVVAEKTCTTMTKVSLSLKASHTELTEGETYDVAAVRIQALDEHGNQLPYFNETIHAELEGPAELIGPKYFSLSGGMGGTYVRTTGEEGEIRLTVRALESSSGGAEASLVFTVRKT